MKVLLLVDAEVSQQLDTRTVLGSAPEERSPMEHHVVHALKSLGHAVTIEAFGPHVGETIARITSTNVDLVFNATEWAFGSRRHAASIAGMLELIGVPFTGTAAHGIAFSLDKVVSKELVRSTGIGIPRFSVFDIGEEPRLGDLRPPIIVKPRFEGGSEGISLRSVVRGREELVERVRWLHRRMRQPAVCEEVVHGREISAAVLGGNSPQVLPIRETVFGRCSPGARIMTSRAKADRKYKKRWGITYQRAELPEALDARVTQLCQRVFSRLELYGYARIDLRISVRDEIYFLEANHNPDLSPGAFGGFARWAGMRYEDVIQRIIDLALARSRASNARWPDRAPTASDGKWIQDLPPSRP